MVLVLVLVFKIFLLVVQLRFIELTIWFLSEKILNISSYVKTYFVFVVYIIKLVVEKTEEKERKVKFKEIKTCIQFNSIEQVLVLVEFGKKKNRAGFVPVFENCS